MNREQYIGSLVKAITLEKEYRENQALRKHGLTSFHMHILLYLYDSEETGNTRSLKELERMLIVSQSTMAKVIKVMVDNKQLLSYMNDPYDRRVKKVTLTPKAFELCRTVSAVADEVEKEIASALTAKEAERLKKLLTKVNKALKA